MQEEEGMQPATDDVASGPIRLPNGLRDDRGTWIRECEMREMTGVEEDLLTNRQHSRDGTTILKLLTNVINSLGEHTDKDEITKLLHRMTLSDATYLTVKLRQLSLGDEVVYQMRCPQHQCQHEANYRVNLADREVTFREEPPQDTYELEHRGHVIKYRVFSISDQPQITEVRRRMPDKMLSMRLLLRIVSVDGTKPNSYVDVQRMPVRMRDVIRGALEEQEYGLDVTIENECPSCGHVFDAALPLGEKSFFFPSGLKPR